MPGSPRELLGQEVGQMEHVVRSPGRGAFPSRSFRRVGWKQPLPSPHWEVTAAPDGLWRFLRGSHAVVIAVTWSDLSGH